ncbi:NAD(P)/FAD-dependent oxidoreductase [Sphingopyxis sp. 550A]|jgi:glycine/D-amino acid oxidase-like deaminating enzyme
MGKSADIVIIGAGIIGMSAAYQIARRSNLRVVVLDKGEGPGEGSTGASSAVCRFRYSHAETVALAQAGIGAYRRWSEFLGTAEPFARFHDIGVLWMTSEAGWTRDEVARLGALGVRTETIDDQALGERYPALNPCIVAPDLVGGTAHDCRGGGLHLLECDGGYMDPVDALQDIIRASRREGVEIRFRAPVADVEMHGGAVAGIRLAGGDTIACGQAIMAAGPWCTDFLAREGLGRWPLEPTRIQIVHIDRPASVRGELPVCVDMPGGIYFRPQNRGQQILIGSVLEEDEREAIDDPDAFATYADDAFIHAKLHALQHRLRLDDIRGPVRGYSGLYTINRADMHPIVGATPVPGLFVANGCSGHGFKLAPAIGSLLAQAITGARGDFDTNVDPAFLAFERPPIPLASMSVLA